MSDKELERVIGELILETNVPDFLNAVGEVFKRLDLSASGRNMRIIGRVVEILSEIDT